jgi:hypothetical protein
VFQEKSALKLNSPRNALTESVSRRYRENSQNSSKYEGVEKGKPPKAVSPFDFAQGETAFGVSS